MILTCSACDTQFRIDPAILGLQGRKVKCTRCQKVWHQEPEILDAPPIREISRDSDDLPMRTFSRPPRKKAVNKGLVIGWSVVAVLLIAFLTGSVVMRQAIVDAWLPAGRFYQAVGLYVKLRPFGLELRNVGSSQDYNGDVPVLTVHGEVVNITDEIKKVPRVRVGLVNEAGREIYNWTFLIPDAELAPHATTSFQTDLTSPPQAARRLAVTFVEN